MSTRRRRSWPLVTTLLVLSAIPVASGTLRLIEVAGGPAIMPANHRYGTFPVPLLVHIVSAIVFALAGIAQFLPGSAAGTPPGTGVPGGSWCPPGCWPPVRASP